MNRQLGLFLGIFLTAILTLAASPNPKATIGGTFNMNLVGEPSMIHPIMSTDLASTDVRRWLGDTLLARDPETYQWKPRLAEKYEISKNKLSCRFTHSSVAHS